MTVKTILAGSAGQQVPAMGRLLAQAALIAGQEVACLPFPGKMLHGGSEGCTVSIAGHEIASPVASWPQNAVVLAEAPLGRLVNVLARGGCLLLDSSLVHSALRREDITVLRLPAAKLAQKLGPEASPNLVMLGALAQATGVVNLADLNQALAQGGQAHKINRAALEAGAEQAVSALS